MSAYGRDIEFWLFRVVVGTAWCVRCARAADARAAFGRGKGSGLQGRKEQLSGTSLSRICADFGHAVSLCRMIASLRFSGATS
jgi:hypothetical protein